MGLITMGLRLVYHADVAEDAKLQQYAKEFPGFSPESTQRAAYRWRSSAWSITAAGARVHAYWDAREIAAHTRQTANVEFPIPLPVISRRVLQTLAIALWRINASRIIQFHPGRRACYGAQQLRNSLSNEAETLAVGPGNGS